MIEGRHGFLNPQFPFFLYIFLLLPRLLSSCFSLLKLEGDTQARLIMHPNEGKGLCLSSVSLSIFVLAPDFISHPSFCCNTDCFAVYLLPPTFGMFFLTWTLSTPVDFLYPLLPGSHPNSDQWITKRNCIATPPLPAPNLKDCLTNIMIQGLGPKKKQLWDYE